VASKGDLKGSEQIARRHRVGIACEFAAPVCSEFFGCAPDHECGRSGQSFERIAKVEAMRTCEDAPAELGRLDRVMPANALGCRATKVDGVANRKPEDQLADCICNEHINGRVRLRLDLSTIAGRQDPVRLFRNDLVAAVGVTRDDHKQGLRMRVAHLLKGIKCKSVLALMR